MKLEHYFICKICAIERGGVSTEGSCTAHKDVCPYCKKESILLAWNDFDWPKDMKLTDRARAERD